MSVQPEGRQPHPLRRRRDPNDPLGYGDKVVGLTQEFDFSQEQAAKREISRQMDAADSYRELNRAANAIDTNDPGELQATAGSRFAGVVAKTRKSSFQRNAERILERENDRRSVPDYFYQWPSVQQVVSDMRDAGLELTDDDIRNAMAFGIVNDAADAIIKADQAGVSTDIRNVMITLSETDPVLASMVPPIVEAKLKEMAVDPNIMERVTGKLLELADIAMTPFVALNEAAMERVRAGAWNASQYPNAPEFTVPNILYGMFSNDAIDAVQPGKFNEEYIRQIEQSGKYSPLQISIARDVMLAAAEGDKDAIINTWQSKYAGNEEAARIFGDIMYARAEGNTQELLRQIDSAYLGNTGQVLFGAGDKTAKYDEFRGTETRQQLANTTGLLASLTFDPTLVGSKFGRTFQAVRWSLAKLAPGESASAVLSKMRLGRLAITTPAYRYFNSFANDLNKLDNVEKAAAAATDLKKKTKLQSRASSMRQRMSRHYDEMPEDLIEDFRTSPWRNVDGKFDVEHLAAAIDDMNDSFVIATGKVDEKIAAAAAQKEAVTDAAIRLNFSLTATEAEKVLARADAVDAARKLQALEKERAGLKSFSDRVASTNQRREVLVPRMSLVQKSRQALVNAMAIQMGQPKAIKLVDEMLQNAGEPAVFAQALSDNAVEFGAANRNQSQPLDSIGRLFSSIPVSTSISLTSAKDAREVYRYARAFLPKRTAEYIADAFRSGDEGSRRLLISGLVRTAAASRGLTETDHILGKLRLTDAAENLVTGTRTGERYGVTVETGAGVTKSLSADKSGVEHAIHLNQVAENVAIPSLRDFEELRSPIRKGITGSLERVTNAWSLMTLYGLRFSMRNAIEEVGLYWLTGGGIVDLIKGRRMDQAIRNARPRIMVKLNTNGEPEVVLRTSLGMFANKAEGISRWMKNRGYPEWMAELVFRQADPESLKAAGIALAQGDTQAFSKLATESLARQKVFGFSTNLVTADDKVAFQYLVESTHGMALLDEIGEASTYLQSGGFPAYVDSMYGIGDTPPGVEFGRINPKKFGGYQNVSPVAVEQGRDIYGLSFWWRELQNTFDDGPIGEAAVRLLRNPAKAKAEIARIIREDREFGYKEKFSRIRADNDIEDFADSYFENVFQHFTKADGTLNNDLRKMFLGIDENGVLRASWWKVLNPDDLADLSPSEMKLAKDAGLVSAKVSRRDLAQIDRKDRPAFVFGREVLDQPTIPMPTNEKAIFGQRAFAWMGRQNARISRDPIFLANYIDQYRQTAQARSSLAKAYAQARARSNGLDPAKAVITPEDTALAERMYAQQAMDNAFSLTLSYVDNPANRSNLAWKIRNVSRYYRATEDFYRRVGRVMKNSPESAWKAALTYQLLGDYGFVYENDNGEKYFAYPGNEFLQKALLTGLNIPGTEVGFNGILGMMGIPAFVYEDIQPFSMGGKALGLTPSADPKQLFPSVMGPVAVPMSAILGSMPQLAGLRSVLLGQYNQTTGNMFQDAVKAMIPAAISKALPLINQEYLDSQVGSSAFDAIAMMMAEGLMDELTINGEPMRDPDGNPVTPGTADSIQFAKSDQKRAADAMATVFLMMRIAGSYSVPASPQELSTSASSLAQRYGVDSIRDAFYDVMDAKKDDPFQYTSAISEFFASQYKQKMKDGDYSPYLLPFIPGQTKYNMDEQPAAGMAQVRSTDDVQKWFMDDKTQELFEKVGSVAWFLAPKTGEFTWASHSLINMANGVRVPKGEWEKYEDLFAFQGQQTANLIRQSFAPQIQAAQTPDEVKAITEEMNAVLDLNKLENPAYAKQLGPSGTKTPARMNDYLSDARQMIAYLRERDGELSDDAQMIENAIFVYTSYKDDIARLTDMTATQRSKAKKQAEAAMIQQLEIIKEYSANAKLFIESILESDPDYTFGVN